MSWLHLQTCKLGTVQLHVQRITVDRPRRLARFEYPGRDGAEHEDNGKGPRSVSLDVVCMDLPLGGSYLDQWADLEDVFETSSRVTFVHPHHGSFTVRIERLRDTTSTEGARFIEGSIELVEDATSASGFTVTSGGLAGAANVFDAAAAAATTALAALT